MNRNRLILIVLASAAVTSVAFQNCAIPSAETAPALSPDSGGSVGSIVEMSAATAQATAAGSLGQCASRQSASSGFPLVSTGGQVAVSGTVEVRLNQVDVVTGTGTLNAYGLAPSSRIDQISGLTGNATVCGASVVVVEGGIGLNLVVEDGTLGSVSNSSGNIILLDQDAYPSLSSFRGNIVLRTTSGTYKGRSVGL